VSVTDKSGPVLQHGFTIFDHGVPARIEFS